MPIDYHVTKFYFRLHDGGSALAFTMGPGAVQISMKTGFVKFTEKFCNQILSGRSYDKTNNPQIYQL